MPSARRPQSGVQGGKAPLAFFLLFHVTTAAASCGTLVIPNDIGQSAPAPIASFDPLLDGSLPSLQAWLLLYRPLVWVGADDRLDTERSLAARIESEPDGKTFRITLKPYRWSDGVPVRASDAVFTWSLIRELGPLFAFAGQGGLPDRVESMTAPDDRTLVVRLKQRTNADWFTLNALSVIAPLPQHAWGAPTAADLWRHQADPASHRVVDGPFRLDRVVPGRYAVFVPNPLYGGHPAQIGRLVVDFLTGASPLHAVESGEVDMANLPPVLAGRIPARPGWRAVAMSESFGNRAMLLNLRPDRLAFLRDVRVRQALTDAADQPAMIRLVYRGHAAEARAFVPPEPPTWLAPALAEAPVRDDPALAARLLDAAGWIAGADGIRRKNGAVLAFSVLVSIANAEAIEELQVLQRNLRAIGVAITVRPVADAALGATVLGGGDWDAAIFGFTRWGVPDGAGFFDTGGGYDVGGYSDPGMDRRIAATASESGTAALFDYETYEAAQQPWNVLPEGGYVLLVSDRVRGLADFLNPMGFWSPEYLSVACDAPARRSD